MRQRSLAFGFLLISLNVSAELTTYECSYSHYSDQKGSHKVDPTFDLTFIIDPRTGNAYLHGNYGSSEVMVLPAEGKISFLEVTGTGNLMTTTIDSTLASAHSRNTVIDGQLLASQYYGHCIGK